VRWGLSQSALVSMRGPLPEDFHAATLRWSRRMTVPWQWRARGHRTGHSICRRSETATAGVSCIQRAVKTTRDNAVSAVQRRSRCRCRCSDGSRLELLALVGPASPNACQHRPRSEWFQSQAAQGSPSSKPGLLPVRRVAGSPRTCTSDSLGS
jgi:hypothetical protein